MRKDLINFYKKQQQGQIWDFYQERSHVENLFCARFNFLIATFAIIIGAFANIDDTVSIPVIILLTVGLFLIISMSFAIYRTYVKLDIVLFILHEMESFHVFPVIRKEMLRRKHHSKGVMKLLGIVVPIFCCLVLLVIDIVVILFLIWDKYLP